MCCLVHVYAIMLYYGYACVCELVYMRSLLFEVAYNNGGSSAHAHLMHATLASASPT